jgi:hypothetical protein
MNNPIATPPSADDARAALADVERIAEHTRRTIAYGAAAPLMIVWGTIWLVGFCASQWEIGIRHRVLWSALGVIGFGISIFLRVSRRGSPVKSPRSSRMVLSWVLLLLYTGLWAFLMARGQSASGMDGLSEQQSHALVAFVCTVPMFAYAVIGLWLGRFYLWLGLTVTGLTLGGYLCLPGYFYLVMGVFGGGSFIAAGAYAVRYWRS